MKNCSEGQRISLNLREYTSNTNKGGERHGCVRDEKISTSNHAQANNRTAENPKTDDDEIEDKQRIGSLYSSSDDYTERTVSKEKRND
jgi:hypothetical protein